MCILMECDAGWLRTVQSWNVSFHEESAGGVVTMGRKQPLFGLEEGLESLYNTGCSQCHKLLRVLELLTSCSPSSTPE